MVFLKREREKQFSTFIRIVNDDFERWIEDPRLKLNMDRTQPLESAKTADSFPTRAWILHWHCQWKQQPGTLPRDHLYAYLQEPCYWAAHRLSGRFRTVSLSLADCFQTGFERSERILQNFEPTLGTSLSGYANRAFSNAIQDALGKYHEVQIASELSLLQRCTKSHLSKVLLASGLSSEMQQRHQAAWQSFKAFYFPQSTTARSLAHLTVEEWAAIGARYKQLKQQYDLTPANDALLQEWLGNCVSYLRCDAAPRVVSFDVGAGDDRTGGLQLQSDSEASIPRLVAQEQREARQQQQQQVAAVLKAGLSALEPSSQQLLQLYYGERLKQQEIAVKLNSKQYKVSRQLRAARQALLKVLLVWSREELHISFEATVLNNMTVVLEDWLKLQFSGERDPAC